jgi:hypothetical protein
MRNPLGGSWNVYQGIVYVLPSQPSAAFPNPSTTVLLPKSHLDLYNELMAATSPYSRSHYCEITHLVDQSARCRLGALFRQGCRRVPAPEGSLLLWNSKTLHQAPLPPRPPCSMTIGIYHCTAEAAAARDSCSQGWTSGRRLAQPVCWEPRSRRDHAALVRKAVMSIRGLPSTHWASLGNCGRQQCLRLALFSHSPFSNRNFA